MTKTITGLIVLTQEKAFPVCTKSCWWSSILVARRQSVVAQSTEEAEYVASCEACMDGREIANILMEVLPKGIDVCFNLGVDSQSALALATSPTYSRKTRHIELRYHFVRDQVVKGQVVLWKMSGDDNPADMLTKPLICETEDGYRDDPCYGSKST
ncbi:Copia type Polyprotein, partial [Phytophthora megakarya]